MSHTGMLERIHAREATVGVVGLGYVGLPLVLTFGRAGFKVIGFDIDPEKIAALQAGESYLRHIPSEAVSSLRETGRLEATTDFAQISACDAVLLCVPTPLTRNRDPDMSYVEGTADAIAPHLRPGQLVILESTTYPGTTDGLLRARLEAGSGLSGVDDLFLAYSPEREDPGNPDFDTQRIPKVVGGLSEAARDLAVALYAAALDQVVPVSSTRVAEMTKLLENIFRAVNIALVNELKVLCDKMDVDVWEVIEAAKTKPFGYMPFYPGPGLGGHCIPIDPFYLTWKAREFDMSTRFIELAGEVNSSMPRYVVERTAEALNTHAKPLNGADILVLGLAYKRDVEDVRESPSLEIIELLQARGAQVRYHDPFVAQTHRMRHHDLRMRSEPLTPESLAAADVVLILTDHTPVDYAEVARHARLVVDTRNATRDVVEGREKIIKA